MFSIPAELVALVRRGAYSRMCEVVKGFGESLCSNDRESPARLDLHIGFMDGIARMWDFIHVIGRTAYNVPPGRPVEVDLRRHRPELLTAILEQIDTERGYLDPQHPDERPSPDEAKANIAALGSLIQRAEEGC